MYHHVLPEKGFIASSVEQFDSQMRLLAEQGYTTLDSEGFARILTEGVREREKYAVITFDDGWRDNLIYAYPILKKYGHQAILFLITEWIEKASERPEPYAVTDHRACKKIMPENPGKVALNWDEVGQMQDVFSYESHTHTHRDGYFSECSWEEEFVRSKEVLRGRLGKESLHLCWPRGKYDSDLMEMAKRQGYTCFYTTRRGANVPMENLDTIRRISMKESAGWLSRQLWIDSRAFTADLYARVKNK